MPFTRSCLGYSIDPRHLVRQTPSRCIRVKDPIDTRRPRGWQFGSKVSLSFRMVHCASAAIWPAVSPYSTSPDRVKPTAATTQVQEHGPVGSSMSTTRRLTFLTIGGVDATLTLIGDAKHVNTSTRMLSPQSMIVYQRSLRSSSLLPPNHCRTTTACFPRPSSSPSSLPSRRMPTLSLVTRPSRPPAWTRESLRRPYGSPAEFIGSCPQVRSLVMFTPSLEETISTSR